MRGHAYVGSFDDSADEPTFVYKNTDSANYGTGRDDIAIISSLISGVGARTLAERGSSP